MASERRQQQVARRIQQKVSEMLLHEIRDPRSSFVTITNVTISRDLVKAKVYWSCLEERHRSKITHMFEHANGFLRRQVARDINIRSAPMLEFCYDEGLMAADRIEQVLRQVLPPEDRTIGELPAANTGTTSELPAANTGTTSELPAANAGTTSELPAQSDGTDEGEAPSPWPKRKDELDD